MRSFPCFVSDYFGLLPVPRGIDTALLTAKARDIETLFAKLYDVGSDAVSVKGITIEPANEDSGEQVWLDVAFNGRARVRLI